MQFYGCGINYPRCKEDCYWYREWQDMGAHIPYCKCKSGDFIEPKDCNNCEQYHSKYKQTNADRIRSMSDEELADEILRWFNWLNAVEWDDKRIIGWLKQEVDT